MKIANTLEKYENDYREVINLFFPSFETSKSADVSITYLQKENTFNIEVDINGKQYVYNHHRPTLNKFHR